MEVFLENPGFIYLEDIEYNTLINDEESGKEKTRNKWPTGSINGVTRGYTKRSFGLVYNSIKQVKYNAIVDFFTARIGRKEAFYWENYNESPILNVYPNKIIITSNYLSENTSQLAHYPIIADTQIIYDDGVALVEGVDYSIVDSTGVITWIIKPANGSVIRANYRFYRVVRFKEDKISFERTAYQIYNLQISVREIEPRL